MGFFLLGLSCFLSAFVQDHWQFLLLQGGLAGIGEGCCHFVLLSVTLAKWFRFYRGWALALMSIGLSMTSILSPLIFVTVIDVAGWRYAWMFIGVFIWCVALPLSLILRRTPEDYDLRPDGRLIAQENHDSCQFPEVSLTRSQAIRQPFFWLMTLIVALNLFSLVSILFHGLSIITHYGLSRYQASLILSMLGCASLLSKFISGWALQRFSAGRLLSLAFLTAMSSMLLMVLFGYHQNLLIIYLAYVLFGLGVGCTQPVGEFIWAQLFGPKHIGAIRGASNPVVLFFGAISPSIASLFYDCFGSYTIFFIFLAVIWLLCSGLVFLLPQRSLAQ